MTKPTVYRIQLHDGSLPGQPLPPERGLFELRDAEWRLHFRHLDPAVTCGLLRSDVEVRAIDRRRCLITLSGRDTPEFTLHLVVRARARRVRADIEHRRNRLGRERELLDAVRDGRWWRDDRIFDRFGPLKTVSITGARYLGGLARTVRVKPTRVGQVMDFGPQGISLRGWRTHLAIAWDQVAMVVVGEVAAPSETATKSPQTEPATPLITVRLYDGSAARFAVSGSTEDELRVLLDPILENLPAAMPQGGSGS